jgi:glycerate kinase
MTRLEAGEIVAGVLAETLPGADLTVMVTADGGEGTTDAVLRAVGGERRTAIVTGPLGDPVGCARRPYRGARDGVG